MTGMKQAIPCKGDLCPNVAQKHILPGKVSFKNEQEH